MTKSNEDAGTNSEHYQLSHIFGQITEHVAHARSASASVYALSEDRARQLQVWRQRAEVVLDLLRRVASCEFGLNLSQSLHEEVRSAIRLLEARIDT